MYNSHKNIIKAAVIIPTDSKIQSSGVLLELSPDIIGNYYMADIYSAIEEFFTK